MDTHLARRSWVEQIMGMPVSVLCRGETARTEQVDTTVRAVFDELRGVDDMFSTYKDDSFVSRVRAGAINLADCPDEVRAVAERADRWRDLTGGLFDSRRPDGIWDPSGLVKGWAVGRAATALHAAGPLDWCLNAGGDVLLHCDADRTFRVGIADPGDATRVLTALALSAGAVATSGTAARGRHIYDPRLGKVAPSRWASVTVTGPSLETADVLATAAFVAGDEWQELLDGFRDYAGLAVDQSGGLQEGPGWPG
jgi:thiamine biosynthesis lipoprotein